MKNPPTTHFSTQRDAKTHSRRSAKTRSGRGFRTLRLQLTQRDIDHLRARARSERVSFRIVLEMAISEGMLYWCERNCPCPACGARALTPPTTESGWSAEGLSCYLALRERLLRAGNPGRCPGCARSAADPGRAQLHSQRQLAYESRQMRRMRRMRRRLERADLLAQRRAQHNAAQESSSHRGSGRQQAKQRAFR